MQQGRGQQHLMITAFLVADRADIAPDPVQVRNVVGTIDFYGDGVGNQLVSEVLKRRKREGSH